MIVIANAKVKLTPAAAATPARKTNQNVANCLMWKSAPLGY